MFSIISSSSYPHHLKQLREWFVLEWGHIDPFEGAHAGFQVPCPLLVINDDILLGGLAFTSAPKPGSTETGIWINALIVAPEQRGVGIGLKLVQAAETEAARIGATELFVFTKIPELYQKQGWYILETKGESKILTRQLLSSE